MNEIKSKGFILRVTQTQEADLIVKILLANGEQISAYARSAMKSRKRFAGGLGILSQIEFRAHKKETAELWQLEESRVCHEFKNISKDMKCFATASYLSELTEICSREGLEHTQLYNLLGAALKALDQQIPLLSVTTTFEAKLLMIMGWLPEIEATGLSELLNRKMSDDPAGLENLPALQTQLRQHLFSHLGGSKLKSLEFLQIAL